MAISVPSVSVATFSSSDGTDVVVTFPTVDMAAGDWIYIFGGHVHNAGDAYGPTTGVWEELSLDTSTVNGFGAWRKLWDGSETQVTCAGSGTSGDACIYGRIILRGAGALSATTTVAGATSTNPNPAAITPSTNGSAVLIAAESSITDAAVTGPNNYTVASGNVNTTRDMSFSIGYRLGRTGGVVEDPPAYGNWGSGTWRTITIAVGEAAAAQSLTATLFDDSTDTFHAPTVGRGAVGLTAALYSDTDAFHAATVTQGQSLTASLYADADSIYAASITTGAVGLTASLYSDADSFYAPTVGRGAVDLTASLYGDADTFYAASVAVGSVALTASLYADADTFYAATVEADDSQSLAPSLFADGDTFFTPAITTGSVSLTASLFVDGDTLFASTVTRGAVSLTASLYADSDSFYAPAVTVGSVGLTAPLYADVDTFYVASILGGEAQNGEASGAVVSATASLVAGTAEARTLQATGVGISGPMPILFSVRAEAPGDTVTCFARLLPGRARTVSLLPAKAKANARASGVALHRYTSVVVGNVKAEHNLTDEELLLLFAEAA